jgi:hypothetical protein
MNIRIGLVSFILLMIYIFILPVTLYQNFLGNLPYMYSFLYNGMSIVAILIVIRFKNKINFVDMTSLSIFILMFSVIMVDYFYYGKSYDVFYDNSSILVRALTLYIIGRSVTFSQKYYYLVLISFIFFVISIFLYLDGPLRIFLDFEGSGVYLFLGDTFAMLSLLLLTNNYKNYKNLNLVIFVLSIFILFVIGSRAALFVYIAVSLLYFFKNYNYMKLASIFLIIFSIVIVFIDHNNIVIENNRIFSVISGNLKNDSSKISRVVLDDYGINDISNNIFSGSYANQYYSLNSSGSYMHNILSYYRQFGLFVFIFIIFLLLFVFKRYYEYFVLNHTKIEAYIPYLSLFIVLECIFFRSYNTAHFWLAIGLLSNYTKGIK